MSDDYSALLPNGMRARLLREDGPPPHDHDRMDGAPEVAAVTVTAVTFRRGVGCCSDSVYRRVTAYYLPDGTLLAEVDPIR